jgi:hypothetical protein
MGLLKKYEQILNFTLIFIIPSSKIPYFWFHKKFKIL